MVASRIFQANIGSHLYGTNVEGSDCDKGEIYLEPRLALLGIEPLPKLPQVITNEADYQRHYLGDFVNLCLKGNPNTIEWLYSVPIPHEYDGVNFDGSHLEELFILLRNSLPLKGLRNAHLGFAKSQMMRMTNIDGNWGAKRKELYAKYGYDVKYASHAIRLLHQLEQLLTFGHITFPYPKPVTDLVKSIKQGNVELEEVRKLYQHLEISLLPLLEKPHPKINQLPPATRYISLAMEELRERLER